MKLDVKAMALTIGLLWGAAMLLTGIANLIWDGYGEDLLAVLVLFFCVSPVSGRAASTDNLSRAPNTHRSS